MNQMINIQSNSIRGEMLKSIMVKTVKEILDDVSGLLGPGATDAFIIKDQAPYYTRDGKEVMESLTFDNELSMYIHHILYQAVYNQGKNVGDGSTSLAVLYCYLCLRMKDIGKKDAPFYACSINEIRNYWKSFTDDVVENIKSKVVPLDEELLKSMLFTCTQDADLAARIYSSLKDAILAGAYIVPRQSNIATDFNVTVYNRPLIKATKQFSILPIEKEIKNAVIFYCNGSLDLTQPITILGLALNNVLYASGVWKQQTYIILCHGLTNTTRETIKSFVSTMKDMNMDTNMINNVAIYTMDDYRTYDAEEIEDVATIITDEPGMGSLVHPLTFEPYLYAAFVSPKDIGKVEELERFDTDPHTVQKFKEMTLHPFNILLDDIAGMALDKTLGPVAEKRYKWLQYSIEQEKSSVRKASLNRRLRKTFGMFIDVEVGSTLLKDSQRKYELILDAIISAADAARDGVIIGNGLIYALDYVYREYIFDNSLNFRHGPETFAYALMDTIAVLINNYYPGVNAMPDDIRKMLYTFNLSRDTPDSLSFTPDKFELRNSTPIENCENENRSLSAVFAKVFGIKGVTHDIETIETESGPIEIRKAVVEPFGVIKAIVENSILPIELAMTKTFHLSRPSMGNYIG